jgi:hypothetical protein
MPEIAIATKQAALPPSNELPTTIADMLLRDQENEFYEAAFLSLFDRWGLDYGGLPGQTPCIKARAKGLHCREMFGDWQTVKETNLPALVQLTSANGRRVYAVISSIEGDSADFKIGDKTIMGDQKDILPYWDGNFLVLEPGEFGYRGDLYRGLSGRNVAWIRSHLSAYYNTPLPAGDQFDYDLFELVLRFQRDNGLAPDGIVGTTTHASLLKMIRARSVPQLQESAKLE